MGAGSSAGYSKAKYDEATLRERYGDRFDEAQYAELKDEEGFVSAEQLRVMEAVGDAAAAPAVDGVGSTAGGAPVDDAAAVGAAAQAVAPAGAPAADLLEKSTAGGAPVDDAAAAGVAALAAAAALAGQADAPTGVPAADLPEKSSASGATVDDAALAAAAAAPAAPTGAPADDLLEKTIARFQSSTTIPKLHNVAQKKYDLFTRSRTAELYRTFFGLVGDGAPPDFSESKFRKEFSACVPFPGKTNERPVYGMAKGSTPHGLIRYEFKGCSIEECRVNGREHGLRVVCTQMGDYWIRLFANGERLAQIVLSSDCSVGGGPTIDDGGLEVLRNHLHLVTDCLKGRT